jgi:hypothetical protein
MFIDLHDAILDDVGLGAAFLGQGAGPAATGTHAGKFVKVPAIATAETGLDLCRRLRGADDDKAGAWRSSDGYRHGFPRGILAQKPVVSREPVC